MDDNSYFCLDIIQDIGFIFAEKQADADGLMGDLFISEDWIHFISYSPFRTTKLFSGMDFAFSLQGGVAGLMFSQVLKDFSETFKTVRTEDEAKAFADKERDSDYGASLKQRSLNRDIVSVPRTKILQIEGEVGKTCIIKTSESNIGNIALKNFNFVENKDLYTRISQWLKQHNPLIENKYLQGVNIGIPIRYLISAVYTKRFDSCLSTDDVKKICSDSDYLIHLHDKLESEYSVNPEKVDAGMNAMPSELYSSLVGINRKLKKDREQTNTMIGCLVVAITLFLLFIISAGVMAIIDSIKSQNLGIFFAGAVMIIFPSFMVVVISQLIFNRKRFLKNKTNSN
jgi:hypothetical protein